jgi:retron-type reverse transcriptase
MGVYKRIYGDSNIREAWKHVRGKGLMSRSRETHVAVSDFINQEEKRLREIKQFLKHGNYRFSAARGVTLRKKSGKRRPIVVHDVADRVVQRALLQVLQKELRRTDLLSHIGSYGGVERRSVQAALREAHRLITEGAVHYIRSDIKSFYDTIPRRVAIRELAEHLPP